MKKGLSLAVLLLSLVVGSATVGVSRQTPEKAKPVAIIGFDYDEYGGADAYANAQSARMMAPPPMIW